MTYPSQPQPGGWPDPSWPPPQQYQDPGQVNPAAYPTSGDPAQMYGQPSYPPANPMYPVSDPVYSAPPQQYGYGGPPMRSTNGLAIASLVLSLAGLVTCGIASLIGAILGHVAKKQIRERGEDGSGMATAGIVIGWIVVVLAVIGAILYVLFIVWAINESATGTYS